MNQAQLLQAITKDLKANVDPVYRDGERRFFKEPVKTFGVRMPIRRKIAAKYWRQNLEIQHGTSDVAVILAKAASAHHLAGEESKAASLAKFLADKHPGATAVLGGRERKVGEFLASIMSMAPMVVQARREGRPSWSGISGPPDGLGLMDDSDAVLAPRWRAPSPLSAGTIKLPAGLIAQ